MLKTTGSSEVFSPRAFGADDDEVVGGVGGGGSDKTVEHSARSSQRFIQASIR